MTRDQLCTALKSNWYLNAREIDALLADREFFQPYLRNALAHRASIAGVPESPIDATDSHAIFLLTDLGDISIIPDLLKCLQMSEEDVKRLYGDALTENLWLPIAKLGSDYFDRLWGFVTDTSVYDSARHTVVAGIVAMHHFHPEGRAAIIAFIERLLIRKDCFPVDELAGILCECADSGLMELSARAKEFAATMRDDEEDPYPMATSNDVLRAFEDGPRKDFIAGRPHTVYTLNEEWQRWAESSEDDEDDGELGSLEKKDETGDISVNPKKSTKTRIGRNDPCPCGSGKKYKKCHGA